MISPRTRVAAVVMWGLMVLASCGGAEAGGTVDFTRGWDGWTDPKIGCVPTGERRRVRGALRIRPFGKGADGTELVLESGDVFVVAYGVTDQHRKLEGVRVIAHGRPCEKQGAAVTGEHFDIEELIVDSSRHAE